MIKKPFRMSKHDLKHNFGYSPGLIWRRDGDLRVSCGRMPELRTSRRRIVAWCRDQVIYHQYKADRARRALRGIGEQIAKAERGVAGQASVKRNWFIALSRGTRTVNRELEATARGASDLQAPPVYHRTRDSIEAHLTIVLAALAVSRWIEGATDWSIRRFVRTGRRYRTTQIQADDHIITAPDPLPDDLRDALDAIRSTPRGTH
jgi:hypothetical protein